MGVKETRRANLATLIGLHGSAEAFASAVGIDPTYVRNIRNGVRNLGDKLARQVEERLGLATGSMDLPGIAGSDIAPHTDSVIDMLCSTFPGLSREDAERVRLVAESFARQERVSRPPQPPAKPVKPARVPVKRGLRRSG